MIMTNERVYYSIARQAYDDMKEDLEKNIRPKSNGAPGYVKSIDPEQNSFKNALICIVFNGIYLESILHILIGKNLGIKKVKQLDNQIYENKLIALDCKDIEILMETKRYRKVRKEIVHEKALLTQEDIKVVQDEAKKSMKLIENIRNYFNINEIENYRRTFG